MALEIERKFLVNSSQYKNEAYKKVEISQGFLCSEKNAFVRVRIQDERGFITIKGVSNKEGTTRYEWEKEIELEDAKNLLLLSKTALIVKTRHFIKIKNHTFEVDEFYGDNSKLVIAEIELSEPSERFEKPNWLGREVTGDLKYYNVNLALKPYKHWTK